MAPTAHPILRIRSPIIGRGEQVFELTGAPVTIGRAEDCDIVLLEQSASRVHARLLLEGDTWTLVDEESHAGVFLGTQRITRHRLADGDRFRIGETDFQIVQRPASQPTLIGATRPPSTQSPPLPSIAAAPTLASSGSGLFADEELRRVPAAAAMPDTAADVALAPTMTPTSSTPLQAMAPPPRPAPPPPPIAAPAASPFESDFAPQVVAPPPMAPAPVVVAPPVVLQPVVPPRPAPPASAPSFVDFGPVGRPEQAPADSHSFTGRLVDDPSRMGMDEISEERVSSRFGTWVLVVLLFIGLSLLVLGLAYDVTISDVMSVFD